MAITKKDKRIPENLTLPATTVRYIRRVAKLSGVSFEDVINVLLAVDVSRSLK